MTSESKPASFASMALKPSLLKALGELGYELPTAIQAQTIPLILDGRDVLGQAQTGTGKTAAFALPILSNLDLKQKEPQVLVLAPTRELAIQVAEAFKSYASQIKSFHVLPVYGGQEYSTQIRALQRGVHVIVGTPGRVMDHMRRGNIKLDKLQTLVLDEADEMLRMGFIDDVEWVLEQTPKQRQIALFSATMPNEIRQITRRYQRNPAEIIVQMKSTTADTIRQRYWPVMGTHKLDALTRILEAEAFDAMLVFVRTKTATIEVAEKLEARGYRAGALNGDIAQKNRERLVAQLKSGKLDVLVATDVAARGLDVDRISHVINYDIPHDTEAYVHRIGRTGRAGRQGDAILFVAPRERRMLKAIESATRKEIELMELPSTDIVNNRRIEKFKQSISDTIASEDLDLFKGLVEQYQLEHKVDAIEVAAALAKQLQGSAPFLLSGKATKAPAFDRDHHGADEKPRRIRRERDSAADDRAPRSRAEKKTMPLEKGMDRYRIEVGFDHKVKPGNIVGAIANEADIDSKYIGRIEIFTDHSLVDLPEDMPKELLNQLKNVRVVGQRLNISPLAAKSNHSRKKTGVKPKRETVKVRHRDKKNKGKPKRAKRQG
ncbi:MAG: DEAD/DEAH box helicase [Gammaproteobacteria bacterium]|nr:DEAD/DEAH box helicase [Gammaproteobacteria bacterium]